MVALRLCDRLKSKFFFPQSGKRVREANRSTEKRNDICFTQYRRRLFAVSKVDDSRIWTLGHDKNKGRDQGPDKGLIQ